MAQKPAQPEKSPDVAEAWADYLDATRGMASSEYEEIEPHAFARLRERLEHLGVKVKT